MGHLNSLGVAMVAQFLLWLFLNIGVPLFTPMFVLVSMSAVFGGDATRAMIRDAIDDGQMYWAAIGLCATGAYEVLTAGCDSAWPSALCAGFLIVYGLVGAGSTLAIAGAVAVAGRAFNRVLRSELAGTCGVSVKADRYDALVMLGLVASPEKFVQWSVRFVATSVIACAGFHLANMVWLVSL
ncbi:MAG TPA: hypothetical protein VL424_04285 [Pararobbsia sp.]|nr:hypothetical protein [Pararobbsia sp.]